MLVDSSLTALASLPPTPLSTLASALPRESDALTCREWGPMKKCRQCALCMTKQRHGRAPERKAGASQHVYTAKLAGHSGTLVPLNATAHRAVVSTHRRAAPPILLTHTTDLTTHK